jgi:hypothetical protein
MRTITQNIDLLRYNRPASKSRTQSVRGSAASG